MKKRITTCIEDSTKKKLLVYGKGALNEGIETVVKIAENKEVTVSVITTLIITAILFAIIPASAYTDLELQNRTMNMSSNFNIYVRLNSSQPVSAVGFDFNYNEQFLRLNYVRLGDFFQYVPSGKYMYYDGILINGSLQAWWGWMLGQYNKSKATILVLNFKPTKKGISLINLSRIVIVGVDGQEILVDEAGDYKIRIT